MRQKHALVLSPFATTPADAGQRKRVRQVTGLLKREGFAITFLFYAFEEGWKARANEARLEQMRRDWGEVLVWRAMGKVGMPPSNGDSHAIDEWWDESLDAVLKQLFAYRYFDVFVVNNVWLSKALDFAPRSTVKFLDTHDIFSLRKTCFSRLGIKPEFFMPNEAAEIAGLNRSDIILGIQENDAAWAARHAKAISICLPYSFAPESASVLNRSDYLHKDKVVFGFLGSAHAFNVAGLTTYCDELANLVGRTAAPVEFRIAGNVSGSVAKQGPWLLEGYVTDEARFLSEIDVAVIPVFDGTGFKVKVADYAAHGIPILASAHAAIGVSLDRRVLAKTPAGLAEATVNVALQRPDYGELRQISEKAHRELTRRASRAFRSLASRLQDPSHTIVYDLTGLSEKEASLVLLGWSGAFQVLSPHTRQLVVVEATLREELQELAPVGVFFVTEEDVAALPGPPLRWMTVANVAPAHWGANAEQVFIDNLWSAALGHPANASNACNWQPLSAFSYYVTWGWIARRVLELAAREQRSLPASIMVTDSRRRETLRERSGGFFRKLEFVSIEDFAEFFQLVVHIASGHCASLAIGDNARPARIKILHDLCAAKGVPFFGPTRTGSFAHVKLSEALPKSLYAQFEREWRSLLGLNAA